MKSNSKAAKNGPPNSEPAAPGVNVEIPFAPGDRFRTVVFVLLTALMIGLCIYLAVPFVSALTWGIALVVIAWPLHAWLRRHVSYPSLAAGLSTTLVVLVVLVPALFVSYELATEAAAAAEQSNQERTEKMVRDAMIRTPGLNQVLAWMDRVGVDLNREVRKLIEPRLRDTAAMLQGSTATLVQFMVMLFVMFYLFRDRDYLIREVRDLLPLNKAEGDQVFLGIVNSIHANLYATVIGASVNGVTGGLVFWAVGLPSPVLWGTVIFILSIVPILGNVLVWIPAALYLALQARWPGAFAVVAWGLSSAILVDSLLFVWLAGNGMRMHKLPTLIAYIGGLAAFGMSGLVLGPAILAVTHALLVVWHHRAEGHPLQKASQKAATAEPPVEATR